jgi:hypothetical protein
MNSAKVRLHGFNHRSHGYLINEIAGPQFVNIIQTEIPHHYSTNFE